MRRQHRRGFTLIELMVVAAIIAVLLTVVMPAIRSLMQTSQLAQADNLMRATLIGTRAYAMKNNVVAGVRFQDDGHMVQVYASNTFTVNDFAQVPVYRMRAVEGVQPERMTDPWRVSVRDVGKFSYYFTWPGTWRSNPNWLKLAGDVDGWFVFPVVLFSAQGRVMLGKCRFETGNENTRWYPTADGNDADNSFNKVTNIDYSYQGTNQGDTFTITSPTLTMQPMLFNYVDFKGAAKGKTNTTEIDKALQGLDASSTDCILDVNTGMIVRTRDQMQTSKN